MENILSRLLRREGGYVDHPDDPGGCTNFGITRGAWELIFEEPITCDELRSLTRAQASEFYRIWGQRNGIWQVLSVDPYLCEVLFDTSVLFGPGRAIRWMQLEAGCDDDGIIGPDTLAHIRGNPRRIAQAIIGRRVMHHAYKVKTEPRQIVFLMGWMGRCNDLLRLA